MRTAILAAISIAGVTALGVGPPTVDTCFASSLGCYTQTDDGKCAGGFASWKIGERSYEEGESYTYAPGSGDKYCFRPFTEDEIFKGGRTTDDFCWSQAARCFMYVENKTMCLYALNRCGSVPGLKTENVLAGDGEIRDPDSYKVFIGYYKEMCQRAADLKNAMELEAQRQLNGFNDGTIINGDAISDKILNEMRTNSAVVWSAEACVPYHKNVLSDANFKPETIAPAGSDPNENPWTKPDPWKAPTSE
ncbi:hypothetical protein BGZ72_002375 [Mortierella alpina]|nr:hypothetical protein BGZ72_002375 [Mortierella alpina]